MAKTQVNLAEEVQGTLPVANGGTALTSIGTGLLTGPSFGTVAAPAGTVVGTSDTMTLTNKRITKRVLTTNAPGATPSINTDNYDLVNLTGIAAAITSMTTNLTGTPVDGDQLIIRMKDGGTSEAITWGTKFLASGVAALPSATPAGKRMTLGFMWDATQTTPVWVLLAVDATGY